jgi:hypothetical protein
MSTAFKPAAPERRSVAGCGRPSGRQIIWAIVFGASLSFGIAVLRHFPVPPVVRYLIPVIPLVSGVFYMRAMVADTRRQMDELQLRIYFEAAAVVVCGLFILMLVYPLLEAAQVVGPLAYWMVMLLIVVLGFGGYFNATRRYR